MKKLFAKMKKIRMTRWHKLTRGEKVAKVIMTLIKWALLIVIGLTVAGIIAAVVAGVIVAFGIISAISGGLNDASHAYQSGDRYVHVYRR